MSQKDKIKLFLDGSRGIYIPQNFAENFDNKEWGVSDEDAEVLKEGPDAELYWETWDEILNTAKYTDEKGFVWYLYQDGDLFAIREDYNHEDE